MISISLPCHAHKCFCSFYAQFTSPEFLHGSMSALIDTGRILADVTVYCLFFLFPGIRNINIISGLENHGLLSGTNFKKIQVKFVIATNPALDGQETCDLMILV